MESRASDGVVLRAPDIHNSAVLCGVLSLLRSDFLSNVGHHITMPYMSMGLTMAAYSHRTIYGDIPQLSPMAFLHVYKAMQCLRVVHSES